MNRILGLGLLLALFCLPLVAAEVFSLASDVRIGDVLLPQGRCEVTWTKISGSQVQLTIESKDRKLTIPARVIQGKYDRVAALTFSVSGVTYLQGFQTKKVRFIVQDPPNDIK